MSVGATIDFSLWSFDVRLLQHDAGHLELSSLRRSFCAGDRLDIRSQPGSSLRLEGFLGRVEVRRYRDDALDLVWVPNPEQQGLNPTVAPSEHVYGAGSQMIEECGEVVRHLLVGEPLQAVAGSALVPAVHRDHLVARTEVGNLRAKVRDAASVAVDDQEELASTVDLVVERDSIVAKGLCSCRIRAVSRCAGTRSQLSACKARDNCDERGRNKHSVHW